VQFDPEAWHRSIEKIVKLPLQRVFLTHFGMHEEPEELASQLHEQIDQYARLTHQVAAESSNIQDNVQLLTAALSHRLMQHSMAELAARYQEGVPADAQRALAGDMELNAQGLVHWLSRSISAAPAASHPD
jgi:transposase